MATATTSVESVIPSTDDDQDNIDAQVFGLLDSLGMTDAERAHARHINGRPKRDIYFFKYGETKCFVGCDHPQILEFIERVSDLLNNCHRELVKNLQLIGFPYDVHDRDGIEPNYLGATAASAWSEDGTVYVWGREHAEHGWYAFSTTVLNHELAHLVSRDNRRETTNGGAPDHLRVDWLAAMQRDRFHHHCLPELDIHRERQTLNGEQLLSRKFGYKSALVSHHAENCRDEDYGLSEDWAESISYYLAEQMLGHIWQSADGQQTFRFTDYYPHRSQLIREFLSSLETGS